MVNDLIPYARAKLTMHYKEAPKPFLLILTDKLILVFSTTNFIPLLIDESLFRSNLVFVVADTETEPKRREARDPNQTP